jgi:hypothetical protein
VNSHRLVQQSLIGLLAFTGLSAWFGGAALILEPSGWAGLSLALLEKTPFHSYLGPGCILFFIVGSSALFASVAVFLEWKKAPWIAAAASAILIGWIGGQVLLLQRYHPLQALCVFVGILGLFLSLYWNGTRAGTAQRLA